MIFVGIIMLFRGGNSSEYETVIQTVSIPKKNKLSQVLLSDKYL